VIQGASDAHTAILYNNTVFKRVDYGCQKIGSAGDANGSEYDRYMLWAKLRAKETGTEIIVVAIHVDYAEAACLAQLQTIVNYLKENQAGVPVIMLGDYNARQSVIDRSAVVSERYSNARSTATAFQNKNEDTFIGEYSSIIDYIYYKSDVSFRGLKAKYYEVLMDDENNPSDHRPIYAEFTYGK